MPTFTKAERLKSKKLIDLLFRKGNIIVDYPVKIIWYTMSSVSSSPVQVLFSVPKKNIKSAVKRNLMKRRMREIYRKNKHYISIPDKNNNVLLLGFIYLGPMLMDYSGLEEKIILILHRFASDNEKSNR